MCTPWLKGQASTKSQASLDISTGLLPPPPNQEQITPTFHLGLQVCPPPPKSQLSLGLTAGLCPPPKRKSRPPNLHLKGWDMPVLLPPPPPQSLLSQQGCPLTHKKKSLPRFCFPCLRGYNLPVMPRSSPRL